MGSIDGWTFRTSLDRWLEPEELELLPADRASPLQPFITSPFPLELALCSRIPSLTT